jgi:hypothetical protein
MKELLSSPRRVLETSIIPLPPNTPQNTSDASLDHAHQVMQQNNQGRGKVSMVLCPMGQLNLMHYQQ